MELINQEDKRMKSELIVLENAGCDIDGALERFLQDEEFYMECYQEMLNDKVFEQLGEALEGKQFTEAFDHAHTIKGVVANMGITPIYDLIVQIVEPLRQEKNENLISVYCELMKKREEFKKVVSLNLEK